MKRLIQDLEVVSNTRLNGNTTILELRADGVWPEIIPGQFAELAVENNPRVYLRRPFSIHFADDDFHTLRFLVKEIGEGTRSLGRLVPGNTVNAIFPLGKGFTLPEGRKVLLVGGGSGLAPLLFLAKYLFVRGFEITTLIGSRTSQDVIETDDFGQYGRVLVTTEDGSQGEKGLVTRHSIFSETLDFARIYTCGPDLMMHAIALIAREHNIECEASLENMMACGFGACLCCVVETTEGNLTSCTEGPVFNTRRLKW